MLTYAPNTSNIVQILSRVYVMINIREHVQGAVTLHCYAQTTDTSR